MKKLFLNIAILLILLVGIRLIYQQVYNPIISVDSKIIQEFARNGKNYTLLIGRDSCDNCILAKKILSLNKEETILH